MGKLLEKALRDAVKEEKCVLGTKQVSSSVADSKLIIVSQSAGAKHSEAFQGAEAPVVRFAGSSVALGRLCGLQFRVSAVSLTSIGESSIKSIIKEAEVK